MNHLTRSRRPVAVVLLALTAALAGCAPVATPSPTGTPVSETATPGPTVAPIGSAHVVLTVSTANVVTIDVTDASGTLIGATSGTPGDGASIEAHTLAVTNVAPATLRLTWVGGPCDSANGLSIDATRLQLLLVQPECPGDAIATDRVLELTFTTPIRASDVEAFLQDGLDT